MKKSKEKKKEIMKGKYKFKTLFSDRPGKKFKQIYGP